VIAGRLDFGALRGGGVGQKLRVLAVFADRRHPSFPERAHLRRAQTCRRCAGAERAVCARDAAAILSTLERACEQAVQSESFRAGAQRMHQPVIYLRQRGIRRAQREDHRYKGELIKALG